jgi:hypothetical protein
LCFLPRQRTRACFSVLAVTMPNTVGTSK